MKKVVIQVSAQSHYRPEQSQPLTHHYLWSYEITIQNDSDEMVQLLNRYWRITDLTGHVEEVYGPGVVGLQPLIKPGQSFVYTSFCQLPTPQGAMEGHYEMQTLEEAKFQIAIAKFQLIAPAEVSAAYRSRLH